MTPLDRFEAKVEPEPMSGCWLWIGARLDDGYGSFWTGQKSERAHRISWLLYRGPIPADKLVCHRCDTPSCVNPAHLFVGSMSDNLKDAFTKGRGVVPYCGHGSQRGDLTHCKYGHPFTPENTLIDRDSWRVCRICKRESESRRPKRTHKRKRPEAR